MTPSDNKDSLSKYCEIVKVIDILFIKLIYFICLVGSLGNTTIYLF